MRQSKTAFAAPAGILTIDELADYLRISRTGVYRLFKQGGVKPIKIGSRTVVRRADADAFLASCAEAV